MQLEATESVAEFGHVLLGMLERAAAFGKEYVVRLAAHFFQQHVPFFCFRVTTATSSVILLLLLILQFFPALQYLFVLFVCFLISVSSSSSLCFFTVQQVSVPLQHVYMLFFLQPFLSGLVASHSSGHLPVVSFVSFLCSPVFMVWLVLLRSRIRYASIFRVLSLDELRLFGLLCLTVWPQELHLSRIKNQHEHWMY